MRALIVGLMALLMTAALGAWFLNEQHRSLERPMATGAVPVELVVKPGSTLTEVADELARRAVLENPRALVWYARWQGLSSRIKAGEYRIPPGATPLALLEQLVDGEVVQWSFTIIEGWTFAQLRAALAGHEKIVNTLDGEDDETVMALLGHPDMHPEGWFYPDTYHFPAGTTDVEFLRRALRTMHKTLTDEWEQRAENLPYRQPYEALILASIVEKETAEVSERGDIAGVFVRRLRKGMRLEADPTVIYGLGEDFDGDLTRRHLETDNPYNTYTRRGLPPTPIAIPSGAAVRAALNPVKGDSLFFVAVGDGSGRHHFSATYAEHREAVRRYLENLRKANGAGNTQG